MPAPTEAGSDLAAVGVGSSITRSRRLRVISDLLEGDEEDSDFIERWREYERARRNGDSRVIEDDG